MEEKTIAIIPARGGSKRIINKNIKSFNGVPLILWTLAEIYKVREIDKVIVSTESNRIIEILEFFNFDYIIRDIALSQDETSSEDVLLDAISKLESNYAITAFIQCTNPFESSNTYSNVIRSLVENKHASNSFSASKFKGWLWENQKSFAIGTNHDKQVRLRSQDIIWSNYIERGSIVAMRTEHFIKTKIRFSGKTLLVESESKYNADIDNPEDFEIAEVIHKIQRSKKKFENIKLLVIDFDGVFSNNMVQTSSNGIESVDSNKYDSLIFKHLKKKVQILVLSSETSSTTRERVEKLKINFIDSAKDKKLALKQFLHKENISFENVAFVGNDLNDLIPMMMCHYSFCPKDSPKQIKKIANEIIPVKGGKGVLRYVYEKYYSLFENDF